MGLITSPGLGSGLDVNAIIEAIVNADKAPIEFRLNRREAIAQTTLSGLGSLKSALSSLKAATEKLDSTSDFNQRKVSISQSGFFTATATSDAALATYAIEVVQLAKGSRLQSSIIAGGSSATFGADTLTFSASGDTFDVDVLATDTLVDIRNKINKASGNSFVSASIITTNDGTRLVYNSSKTGVGNDLTVTSGTAALDPLALNATSTQASQDAIINLDGAAVNSSTNTFSSAISDVTITAQKANPATETSDLTVSLDTASTKKAIEDFIKAYNTTLDELNKLTVNSDTERGVLANDGATRGVINRLRNIVSETVASVTGDFKSLSSIGVTTKRDGTLELKTSVLDGALSNNLANVINLFSNTDGVSAKLKTFVDQQIGGNGVIPGREEGIQTELSRISKERETLAIRVDKLESRLRAQYAALDAIVSSFNSTSTFIAQNLTRIPNFGGSKD